MAETRHGVSDQAWEVKITRIGWNTFFINLSKLVNLSPSPVKFEFGNIRLVSATMERLASVGVNDSRFGCNQFYSPSFSSSSFMRHVKYSCGSCGYELNMSSTNQITSTIGSKYGKSMKSGIISFFNIDEGRFIQVDEFQCMPHFSRYSWGLFKRITKLFYRKCNNYIGNASQEKTPEYALVTENSDSSLPRNGVTGSVNKYDIRIYALQPSSTVSASNWRW